MQDNSATVGGADHSRWSTQLDTDTVASNLLATYRQAIACNSCDSGSARGWYQRYHRLIKREAVRYGRDVELAFAVFALHSINATLDQNIRDYLNWCKTGSASGLPLIADRMRRLKNGEAIDSVMTFPSGLKVRNFWLNLRYPWRVEGTTADRWHARAMGLDVDSLSLARYRVAVEATRMVRKWTGERTENSVQAIVWVHVRDCIGGVPTYAIPPWKVKSVARKERTT